MYSLQCSNPLYGTTENPHKKGREAGGSSGGEVSIFGQILGAGHSNFPIQGALVGGGGSILGLGSDIGGR